MNPFSSSAPPVSRRARLASLIGAALVGVTACTSSAARPTSNDVPLPSTAPTGARICGFVAKTSADTVLASAITSTSGSPDYEPELTGTPPSAQLIQAVCTATTSNKVPPTASLSIAVFGIGQFNDQEAQVISAVRTGHPTDLLPVTDGIGYARTVPTHDSDAKHRAAQADALWGDYYLTVYIGDSPTGRDPAKDALALLQQVATTLKLSRTATIAYPTPAPSSS